MEDTQFADVPTMENEETPEVQIPWAALMAAAVAGATSAVVTAKIMKARQEKKDNEASEPVVTSVTTLPPAKNSKKN